MNCDTVAPNQMSDVYRNYQPASIPLDVEKHLNFIEISSDNCMLLGSGNLNGRYWTGSVHYFNKPTESVSKEDYLTGISCDSVVCDGKFIGSKDKVVIGEDSGCVSIFSLTELEDTKSTHVVPLIKTYDHDSAVLSLSVSPDKTRILSGSMDKCIKVWETDELVTVHVFRPAHAREIMCVQCSLTSDDIFASCSLDGCTLIWDTRQPKPATVVKQGIREGFSSLAWSPLNDKIIAVGSTFGNISFQDIRAVKSLTSLKCLDRVVHKIVFNSKGLLAVCGDTHEVKVIQYNEDSLNVIYSDDRHNDFVRGLAWNPLQTEELYSCGWDKKIYNHTINVDKVVNTT